MEEQKYLVVVNDIEIVGRQMTLEYALMSIITPKRTFAWRFGENEVNTMSRYIDADALKRYIDDCDFCTNCKEKKLSCDVDCPMPDCLTKDWERVIDEQPTVDAVPVVRCKDCKHHEVFKNGVNGWCNGHGAPTDVTYFCADGERRTDEQQT